MSNPLKLLIIDDDDMLRQTLREQFAADPRFTLAEAQSVQKAVVAGGLEAVDLLIAGEPPCDADAYSILKRNGFVGATITLAGKDVAGEAVSPGFLRKPFRFGQLLGKIEEQMRTVRRPAAKGQVLGPYAFRPSEKGLIRPDGSKLSLTDKETEILTFLLAAQGEVVRREWLLQNLWGYHEGVTTHTLETHVYRLRQKLDRDSASGHMLVTEGGGYKLVP